MRFYYTTSVSEGATQLRPDLSLGGFRSANVVPNASLHNLFSDISIYTIMNRKEEYIALILRNESDSVASGVSLWFSYPTDSQVTMYVSAVALSSGQMERITTPYQAPYNAEFHAADGEANAVEIGDIGIDEAIGIWFKRSVNVDAVKAQYSDSSLISSGNPVEGNEDIGINLSWTATPSQA